MVAMEFPISPQPEALFELSLVSFVLLFLPSFADEKLGRTVLAASQLLRFAAHFLSSFRKPR
jgi:hypothetical protein